MISETEEGRPFPLEEFKELLGSVPAEKVDRLLFFAVLTFWILGEHNFCLWKEQFAASGNYFQQQGDRSSSFGTWVGLLGMNPMAIFSSFQGWCYGCHWSIRDKITSGGAFWPGKMQGKNIRSNIGSSFWGNCKRPSRRPQTRLARWIGKGEGYGEIFYSSQHFGTRVGELHNSFIIPITYAQLSVAVYKKSIALCDFVWPCMLRWAEERCQSMMPSTATKLGGLCFKSFLLLPIMDARTSSISFWNLGIFGTRALKQWLK